MRAMRSICMALLFVTCCQARIHAPLGIPKYPSMSLIGRAGMAHACAVFQGQDKRIYTAAHVVANTRGFQAVPLYYLYQQGAQSGFLSPAMPAESRDLGALRVDIGDVPKYLPRVEETPQLKSTVYWQEFDHKDSLRIIYKRGTITNLQSGHIVFKPAPKPGASGGCLLDSLGSVLGIVIWRLPKNTGMAVDLTGHWWLG